MPFIAIDFEASCLPQHGRSFPIEVGIASSQGWSRSWLIRPHASWTGWGWTREAEALHGLSLERLHDDGMEASRVALLLRAAVGHDLVIADSHFDDAWSRTLFTAAGEHRHMAVRCLADLQAFHAVDTPVLARAIKEADRQRTCRHRAEDDARWLVRLLCELGLDAGEHLIRAKAA